MIISAVIPTSIGTFSMNNQTTSNDLFPSNPSDIARRICVFFISLSWLIFGCLSVFFNQIENRQPIQRASPSRVSLHSRIDIVWKFLFYCRMLLYDTSSWCYTFSLASSGLSPFGESLSLHVSQQ